MTRRGALRLALAALALLGSPASAAEWSWPELLAEMSAIKASEAVFHQEVHVSYLSEPMRFQGRVSYRAPDFMAMRYEGPRRDSVIFEGDIIRVRETPEGAERVLDMADQPFLKAVIQSLRATLSGNARELTAAFQIGFEGASAGWTLRLSPIDEEMSQAIAAIVMRGSGTSILRYELLGTDGDRIVFVFAPAQ